MRIGRTIIALLVALSVAMLPAASGAAAGSKSPAAEDMSASDMSPTDMSAMEGDCCPNKANPCAQMDDCGSMATCALKCFSFSSGSSSIIVFPSTFAKMATPFASNPFSSQTGTPPFRPPRV